MVMRNDYGHLRVTQKSHEVPAGEFKAHCLKLMDEVRATRRPIVITKRGKPVARLVPIDEEAPRREIFGCMKGTLTIHGDVISPIDIDWHAERGLLYVGEDEEQG
jgi:prevent-host-death family protein